MLIPGGNTALQKTTSYKVVLPFYLYAAASFFAACILLLTSTDAFSQHYFNPHTLAITHLMALGWGTMIILGASHQLVPVLIEGELFSNKLAYLCFFLAGLGIPLLAHGFYVFNFGWLAQTGATAVNIAILLYLVNLSVSISRSKKRNIPAVFVLAATAWLMLTTIVGLLLLCNFTHHILSKDSVSYLSLHAHMGIIGWFLLLIIGVGSRLIPLFLISKFTNNRLLWWIFACVNLGLLSFVAGRLLPGSTAMLLASVVFVFSGIVMFAVYCYKAYQQRIRNAVDEQMKVSLLSVLMMLLPVICLVAVVILFLFDKEQFNLVLLYGFSIFFGWITAIIFGMTFKTLPFIVWNKVYHKRATAGKTPGPKELFNEKMFRWMTAVYLIGFVLFALGLITLSGMFLKTGALALLLSAVLYCLNVFIVFSHKPKVL
jgi:hypothetical protein